MRKLLVNLPQSAIPRFYKSFVRPHLKYSDISCDKPDKENFQNKT